MFDRSTHVVTVAYATTGRPPAAIGTRKRMGILLRVTPQMMYNSLTQKRFEAKKPARESRMRIKPPKDTPPASWDEAVERFMGRLTERRKSAKTIRCYREELLAFGEWYKSEFEEPAALSDIMESDPPAWLTWLRTSQKLKAATINKKLAALKSFLRRSEIKGFSEPLEMPEPLKKQRGAIRWLNKNQEHALLLAVHKGKVLKTPCDRVFYSRRRTHRRGGNPSTGCPRAWCEKRLGEHHGQR